MHSTERLLVAIGKAESALAEQKRHVLMFKNTIEDLKFHVESFERGIHGYAAKLARMERHVEDLCCKSRTLERIMAAAETGRMPNRVETPGATSNKAPRWLRVVG